MRLASLGSMLAPMASLRLFGFGVTLSIRPPFRIDRVDDAPETTLQLAGDQGSEVIDVRERLGKEDESDGSSGGGASGRGPSGSGASGAWLEVTSGPSNPTWRIATSLVECAWPWGFGVASDPDGMSPFLLLGPREAMAWIAGPVDAEHVRPVESLASEEQTILGVADAEGGARIDLAYEHEGEPFWQRRYVVDWGEGQALVLTAQARPDEMELAGKAVDLMEKSLRPASE